MNKLYRARQPKFLGVCEGIARWRDLPVSMIRTAVIIAGFFTGFIPVLVIYVVVAMILETEPIEGQSGNEDYKQFVRKYKTNRKDMTQHIKQEYERVKQRLNRMENDVINREKDWEERFRRETT